jgi:hypothetical protein
MLKHVYCAVQVTAVLLKIPCYQLHNKTRANSNFEFIWRDASYLYLLNPEENKISEET